MPSWMLVVLVALTFVAFFPHNGSLPSDIMESRNLVTAREMAYEGHWLVPTMNGQLRLEKPPLPTWVAGAVELVQPHCLPLQRAMAGAAACLLTLFLFLLVRRITPGRAAPAVFATLLLLTCYDVVQMGRLATWDIYCHAFMMGAIYFLYRGLTDTRRVWLNTAVAGLLMGLSFLSKGPVAFYALLLPFLLALPLLGTARLHGRWGAIGVMVLLCVAVSTWWYIYILVAHPDLAWQVIHKESSSWSDHNVRPWYYYASHFSEVGQWSLLLLTSLLLPLWNGHISQPRPYRFALTWLLLQLLLLSLLPEKKTRYMLPMMVPAATCMAMVMAHWAENMKHVRGLDRALYYVNATVLSLVPLAVGGAVWWLWREGMAPTWAMVATAAAALLLCAWQVMGIAHRRAATMVMATALLFAFAELVLMPTAGQLFNNPDRRSIAATRTDPRLTSLPFYCLAEEGVQIEVVCQAGRKILPVSASRLTAAPCVLVTQRPFAQACPPAVRSKVTAVPIGRYDDSTAWRLQKHRGRNFVTYVTLLKPKK